MGDALRGAPQGRGSSHSRAVAAAMCPVSEATVAVLFSSGRIVFCQLVGFSLFPGSFWLAPKN